MGVSIAQVRLPAHIAGGAPDDVDALACGRIDVEGVAVTLFLTSKPTEQALDRTEVEQLFSLLEATIARFKPDIIVGYGGGPVQREIFAHARRSGVCTVFELHNFQYMNPQTFGDVDAIRVPSHFAAGWYAQTLGLRCHVLPNLIDHGRVTVPYDERDPKYITFVNPAYEKGVFMFSRIAYELGRIRPDIPILVVEGRGTESTVASCGLDLRDNGNVFFISHTRDPREFYGFSRVVLIPSVWWENQSLVAIESMINGIPVVGSDRGGMPETLGCSGIALSIPDRLTPFTRLLPTSEEVWPWIEVLIRLWDDSEFYREHQRLALSEAVRWNTTSLERLYVQFFNSLQGRRNPFALWSPTKEFLSGPATTWHEIPGMFDFQEVYDSAVAEAVDGSVFVEIGCLLGRSTCYLGSKIRESGKKITLYAIDTGRGSSSDSTGQEIAPAFGGTYAGQLVSNVFGCGLERIVIPIVTDSVSAAELFMPMTVDFAFVDADHSHDSVLSDLEAWWPKIRSGGLLAGHDYNGLAPWLVGVTSAVHEFFDVSDASHPENKGCWMARKS